MKTQKINNILYFFDKDNFGYPVQCEQGHQILETNNMAGMFYYKCETCNRKYDIIIPEGGYKLI